MEYHNINNTQKNCEIVTSTYADIYLGDTYCMPRTSKALKRQKLSHEHRKLKNEWVSPSDDLLVGIVELKPPFTSKITRGKTHEGILAIGNAILAQKRTIFLDSLSTLLQDNDSSWNYILANEKQEVIKQVKASFLNIYEYKSGIMKKEISNFYECSLQELEEHLRSEIYTVLQSTLAAIISNSNNDIQHKLQKERKLLVDILTKKHRTEVQNIKKYYKLLLDNELYSNSILINKAIHERNDAVKAFYKQIEAKSLTSTMYIMSLERKKCQIKKMLLENFQTVEIAEKLNKIKTKVDEIEALKQKNEGITDINKQWEDKIRSVLQLYLKFISFSLKLLPEQTTFLLDLEKMVVLQLNEILKNPNIKNTVLFEEEERINIFNFPIPEQEVSVCEKEPFVLVGDLSEPIPPHYGSCETLPPEVDLPFFRLGRQYVYAKCHEYESITKFLDSQICKCDLPFDQKSLSQIFPETMLSSAPEPVLMKSESSLELLVIDDFLRLHECPTRKCWNLIKRNSFPFLDSYLDYSEENFKRVSAIFGQIPKNKPPPKLISPKTIANKELPFAATKEINRTAETQYSSQEDLSVADVTCTCIGNALVKHTESHYILKSTPSQAINEILLKRKLSLQRLVDKNPSLLKIFTDECFDSKNI